MEEILSKRMFRSERRLSSEEWQKKQVLTRLTPEALKTFQRCSAPACSLSARQQPPDCCQGFRLQDGLEHGPELLQIVDFPQLVREPLARRP
jgi:hypothetical protein